MKRVSNYSLFLFGVVVGSTTTLFQIFTLVKLVHLSNFHHSRPYRGAAWRVKFQPPMDVHKLRAAPAARPVKFPGAAATTCGPSPMDVQELA